MSQSKFIQIGQAQPPLFVGVDLGGTNIKVGVVDDLGRPLSWLSVATKAENGPEDGARRMGAAVHEAISKAGARPDQVARIGLGSPGTMDIPAGMLLDPPNLAGWTDFPIRDRLAAHARLPVSFENDANAAAYGEFWVGSGRALRSMVMFTLGTGIGCGIVVDDLVLRGEHSHGAECGHIIIDCRPDAPICSCGQPWSSGSLLQRQGGYPPRERSARQRSPQFLVRARRAIRSRRSRWPGRPKPATNWPWNSFWKRPATWPWA